MSNVAYTLDFTLTGEPTFQASSKIDFDLADVRAPLTVDLDKAKITSLTVNGKPVASFLACQLETGRTHQVRVHMASIGHPLVGDPVYGRTRSEHRALLKELGFHRQALHAAHLEQVDKIAVDTVCALFPETAAITTTPLHRPRM